MSRKHVNESQGNGEEVNGMSEKEQEIIRKLNKQVETMSTEQKNMLTAYAAGLADGVRIAGGAGAQGQR